MNEFENKKIVEIGTQIDVINSPSPEENTAEEGMHGNQEQAVKDYFENHTRVIEVFDLPPTLVNNITQVIESLNEVSKDLQDKKILALEHSRLVRERVLGLVGSGVVKVDEAEYKYAEQSVAQYGKVLDDLCREVEYEYSYFSSLLNATFPLKIRVPLDFSGDGISALVDKVKSTKRYVKNILRDLSVSYSRYRFGFEHQMRRIDYVEKYVSRNQK